MRNRAHTEHGAEISRVIHDGVAAKNRAGGGNGDIGVAFDRLARRADAIEMSGGGEVGTERLRYREGRIGIKLSDDTHLAICAKLIARRKKTEKGGSGPRHSFATALNGAGAGDGCLTLVERGRTIAPKADRLLRLGCMIKGVISRI